MWKRKGPRVGLFVAVAAVGLLALLWRGESIAVWAGWKDLGSGDGPSITVRIVDQNGKEHLVDGFDNAAVERALLLVPEEAERESLRKSVAEAVEAAENRGLFGLSDSAETFISNKHANTPWDLTVERETNEGSRIYKDLVAGGADVKTAKAMAERAVADSLRKQMLLLQGDESSGPVEVTVTLLGNPHDRMERPKWSVEMVRGGPPEQTPPGVTPQQMEDYVRNGTLPPGWTAEKLNEWGASHGAPK